MKNGQNNSAGFNSQEKQESLFDPSSKQPQTLKNTPVKQEEIIAAKVKELVGIMMDEGIAEIDIKDGNFSIYVKRKSPQRGGDAYPGKTSAPYAVGDSQKPVSSDGGGGAPPHPATIAEELAGKRRITSPINGVFYKASSPKSPPFVSEGDVVEAGKTLCIIEAMKVMNEIKADTRMKILRILVENGKTVNQGEPIFIVE